MKKTLFTLVMTATAICSFAQNEQERSIKMPEVPKQHQFTEFSLKEKGYWWSADISIGSSLTFHEKNLLTTGVNFVNGYRFNDYLKIGIGVGAQYHAVHNDAIRNSDIKWSMPIFVNVRGNFTSQEVREIVPYWSVDIGGVIRDGFMFTPSFGCRMGEQRSAFLLGVGYSLRTIDAKEGYAKTRSYAVLKIGYEF